MPDGKLSQKTAVVTGGGSGIGQRLERSRHSAEVEELPKPQDLHGAGGAGPGRETSPSLDPRADQADFYPATKLGFYSAPSQARVSQSTLPANTPAPTHWQEQY